MTKHAFVVVLVFLAFPSISRASVSLCGSMSECVCIYWPVTGGEWLEKRCPNEVGWVSDPNDPITDPGGSWGGGGVIGSPESPEPGNSILAGALLMELNAAIDNAQTKLRGDRVLNEGTGKYEYVENECSDLFNGSPLDMRGPQVIANITFRDGENLQDANGEIPCNQGVSLWTTCCNHRPYVFVCDTFENLSSSTQIAIVIHEAMHVAGQLEDWDSSTGPNDPPNTAEITAQVKDACGL